MSKQILCWQKHKSKKVAHNYFANSSLTKKNLALPKQSDIAFSILHLGHMEEPMLIHQEKVPIIPKKKKHM